MSEHNLKTSAGGRGYIADFFRKQMKRRDFDTYIRERLAADFACALAAHLEQKEAEAQALREEVAAANDRADTLEHRMMGMMTRHFAEAWRNRDTQKALDGYLSAGIAELERERDAALAEVARIKTIADNYYALCVEREQEIAALRARVVVPDGYALVPIELTRDMWIAVNKADDKAYSGGCDHGAQFDWLWAAALDAAPRLNGKAVSEGLLRETVRSVDDIFWAIHAKPSCQSGVVARCRCRLCAGTRLAMARDDLNALLGEVNEHD